MDYVKVYNQDLCKSEDTDYILYTLPTVVLILVLHKTNGEPCTSSQKCPSDYRYHDDDQRCLARSIQKLIIQDITIVIVGFRFFTDLDGHHRRTVSLRSEFKFVQLLPTNNKYIQLVAVFRTIGPPCSACLYTN